MVCDVILRSAPYIIAYTVYGKTFKWENFCGLYAYDHSRENVCGCLSPRAGRYTNFGNGTVFYKISRYK